MSLRSITVNIRPIYGTPYDPGSAAFTAAGKYLLLANIFNDRLQNGSAVAQCNMRGLMVQAGNNAEIRMFPGQGKLFPDGFDKVIVRNDSGIVDAMTFSAIFLVADVSPSEYITRNEERETVFCTWGILAGAFALSGGMPTVFQLANGLWVKQSKLVVSNLHATDVLYAYGNNGSLGVPNVTAIYPSLTQGVGGAAVPAGQTQKFETSDVVGFRFPTGAANCSISGMYYALEWQS